MSTTKWEGLWLQEGSSYSGYPIKKSEIPKYTRLIVRHNKYWKKDNEPPTPRYVYCFADADGYEAYCRPLITNEGRACTVYVNDGGWYKENGERLYTEEEVRKIINGTVDDVKYGISDPYDILPEDFV